ncbi:MAG: glycoside hydrolase family 15 protein [Chloroflexi bacterium]|nr:glycoside hydrolase family 15 protein [Chloroflexota bacterium]
MTRDLSIGNGQLLINYDLHFNLADIYYPHVGKYIQTNFSPSRFGVYIDDHFAWLDDARWSRELHYQADTLVTQVTAIHSDLRLKLLIEDCVDFDRTLYVRRIRIQHLDSRPSEVRLFFHLDPYLYGIAIGDTMYYEPIQRALIAYKDRCYIWLSGMTQSSFGLSAFATGLKHSWGQEGTWRDAEDGVLSGNPIVQGSVDGVGALTVALSPDGSGEAYFWMAFGASYDEVEQIANDVKLRRPDHFLQRTADYWRLWVTKRETNFNALPPEVAALYRRSLLITRTQIDDGGGIVAANDAEGLRFGRDTYSYVWPRDGALVARSLILAGYPEVTREFFAFCARVMRPEGYLLHKYAPDGCLGSSWHPWVDTEGVPQLPIQEDETALVLHALWLYFDATRDVEFIKPFYRPLIKGSAEFLVRYRDPWSKLPLPSYDLWEERHGVHTFTVATVIAGLEAATRFTTSFGETDIADRYRRTAQEVREAAIRFLYVPELGRFARRAISLPTPGRPADLDLTVDSSLAAFIDLGFLPLDDARLVGTLQAVEQRLWCHSTIGGVARYEADHYYRQVDDTQRVPGNPWPVCTLWLAEWYIARAQSLDDLKPARALLQWVTQRAFPSGTLAEQFHPETGQPLSVAPLTWSHSAFVAAVILYVQKAEELAKRGGSQEDQPATAESSTTTESAPEIRPSLQQSLRGEPATLEAARRTL